MKEKTITTQQAIRYSRQISLAGFDLEKQEKLMNSRVLMIGAGGLGCAASQYLVAAGIGQLTIVDDDKVEISNLQRQVLHFEESVGRKKVESASDTLGKINPNVEIITFDKRLSTIELKVLIEQNDLVLDCSDNLPTRNQINDLCYAAQIPLVSGAVIRMEGQVFCVSAKLNTACYRCLSYLFGEQNLTCVESGVMSPVVGIIGATQANEAIKILTQYGKVPFNTLQMYDAMVSSWQSFKIRPHSNCQTCAKPN